MDELTRQLQSEREVVLTLRAEVADLPAALEALGAAQVWESVDDNLSNSITMERFMVTVMGLAVVLGFNTTPWG